jgi:hypothetical protein
MNDNVFGIEGKPLARKPKKFVLDVKKDVDLDNGGTYMLWLPYGFRFSDEVVHVRGYDSLAELRASAKQDVVPCECADCVKHPVGKHVGDKG